MIEVFFGVNWIVCVRGHFEVKNAETHIFIMKMKDFMLQNCPQMVPKLQIALKPLFYQGSDPILVKIVNRTFVFVHSSKNL